MHTFNLGTLEITLLISMTRRLKTICGLKQWKYIKWQTIKKPRWMRMTYQWNRWLENSRRKNIFKDLWLFLIFVHVHLCVHMYSWEQVHLQAKDFIFPWSYTYSWFLWTQPISHSKNYILFLSMHKFILLFFVLLQSPWLIQPFNHISGPPVFDFLSTILIT